MRFSVDYSVARIRFFFGTSSNLPGDEPSCFSFFFSKSWRISWKTKKRRGLKRPDSSAGRLAGLALSNALKFGVRCDTSRSSNSRCYGVSHSSMHQCTCYSSDQANRLLKYPEPQVKRNQACSTKIPSSQHLRPLNNVFHLSHIYLYLPCSLTFCSPIWLYFICFEAFEPENVTTVKLRPLCMRSGCASLGLFVLRRSEVNADLVIEDTSETVRVVERNDAH